VAAALGLPNAASPFEPPTNAQVAAAALPFQKNAPRNATSDSVGGGAAGEARRLRQVREQTDVDVRLFHHAAAMSTAGFRSTSPVMRTHEEEDIERLPMCREFNQSFGSDQRMETPVFVCGPRCLQGACSSAVDDLKCALATVRLSCTLLLPLLVSVSLLPEAAAILFSACIYALYTDPCFSLCSFPLSGKRAF
jgi:hypothetical protein